MLHRTTIHLAQEGAVPMPTPVPDNMVFARAVAGSIQEQVDGNEIYDLSVLGDAKAKQILHNTHTLARVTLQIAALGPVGMSEVAADRAEVECWLDEGEYGRTYDPRVPFQAAIRRYVLFGGGVEVSRSIQTAPGGLSDATWVTYGLRDCRAISTKVNDPAKIMSLAETVRQGQLPEVQSVLTPKVREEILNFFRILGAGRDRIVLPE
jgi:hypothetical protein